MTSRACGSQFHRPALSMRHGLRHYRPAVRRGWRDLAEMICRRIKNDQAAALVETAIASMIFFAVLLGVFQFALGFYIYHYSSNAARQASRYAIVRGSECSANLPAATSSFHCNASEADITAYVKGLGYPGVDAAHNLDVTVNSCAGSLHTDANGNPTTTWAPCIRGTSNNDPGDQVKVTVTYAFPLVVPFWKAQSVGISSTSSMVYSQ